MPSASQVDQRLLETGDEAGTPPSDRPFRPDVEGLRAVAVLLVVLYHANLPGLTGGYVGVDVFFVISGFVITGLLLRERAATGQTSIIGFYARRVRRILPAATLVILAAVAATYLVLGAVSGNSAADDGRWAAIFLSNFHFEATGTNYLAASLPPSPLQNFWSLSVEEQFYILFPTLLLVIARIKGRLTLQIRMALVLGLIIVASFWLSVAQTASHPAAAFFSPLTRAWELALGALIAVGLPALRRLPSPIAATLSWLGLSAVLLAAVAFNSESSYPGALVAIPVLGAGLVIVGGVTVPRYGAEVVLGLPPSQWVGRRSYSLYLWHWPILIIAAERVGKISLTFEQNLPLLGLALVLSIASYALVENPFRHLRTRARKSVTMGLAAIVLTVAMLTMAVSGESASARSYRIVPVRTESALLSQVAQAASITKLPSGIKPDPTEVLRYWGGDYESAACQATPSQWKEQICTLGDRTAKRLMVVYGDSHALMWLPAFRAIASAAHWRLVVLAKTYCPAELVTIVNEPAFGNPNGPDLTCDKWHTWATTWIKSHNPTMLVISQESAYRTPATSFSPPTYFTAEEWGAGLADLIHAVRTRGATIKFLGNIPGLPVSPSVCVASHRDDLQACSSSTASVVKPFDSVEARISRTSGVGYIDTTPWFCSAVCTAVVDRYLVYRDQLHINSVWAVYLTNVLSLALGIHDGGVAVSTVSPAR